jgi:hypothetical protein
MYAALAILLALSEVEPVKVPSDPGLYFLHGKELTRIEARHVNLSQGGGGGRGPKIPMKSHIPMSGGSRVNAQILGEHAEHTVTAIPVFYYRPAAKEGTGAADLVLVKLKARKGRREFVVSSAGDWKTSSGIPLRSQVEFFSKQVESGVYQLTASEDLEPGEYGFYLFRGHDMPGLIYDFSVE